MLHLTPFQYKFIPSEEAGEKPALLILVHGRTGNLKVLEWEARQFQTPPFSCLMVQAPYPDRRPDQKDEGFSWYLEKREGIEESRKGFYKLVEEISKQGFAPERTYWIGFSQGAAMCLDLALRGPFKLGGVICVSGFCVDAKNYPMAFGPFANQQRILITHGTRDEVVTLEYAEKTYDILRNEKISFEFKVFDKPHSFQMREEVPFLKSQLETWVKNS